MAFWLKNRGRILFTSMLSEEKPLDASKNIVEYGRAEARCRLATVALVLGLATVFVPASIFAVCGLGIATVDTRRISWTIIVACCVFPPPAAVITGFIALHRLKRLEVRGVGVAGAGPAAVGLLIGLAGVVIYGFLIVGLLVDEWRFG